MSRSETAPRLENAATAVVLESDRRIGTKIARVVASVAALEDVAYVDRPEALPDFVGARTRAAPGNRQQYPGQRQAGNTHGSVRSSIAR